MTLVLESPPDGHRVTTPRTGAVASVFSLVSRGRDAMHQVAREFVKFGVIGAVAFVVDFSIYQALVHLGNDPILESRPVTARIIAAAVATVVAWTGNRYWTFRHRRRSEIRREAVLFAIMNVIGIGIAAGCLAISRYALGLSSSLADNIASYGFGTVLGMAFRFTAYRYVVFRGDRETPTPPPATTPPATRPPVAAQPSAGPSAGVPATAVYRSPAPATFGPHIIPGTLPD